VRVTGGYHALALADGGRHTIGRHTIGRDASRGFGIVSARQLPVYFLGQVARPQRFLTNMLRRLRDAADHPRQRQNDRDRLSAPP